MCQWILEVRATGPEAGMKTWPTARIPGLPRERLGVEQVCSLPCSCSCLSGCGLAG